MDNEALNIVQQVFLLRPETHPQVVVFAGIDHGSGSSMISASVAEVLARTTHRPVCLVEGNFRSPSLSSLCGSTNKNGLSEALVREDAITTFTRPLSEDNLWLLPSGSNATDAPSLITSDGVKKRIAELREAFAFIIVDAPPLKHYSEAMIFSQLADGVVLILEAGSTRRESAAVALSSLRSANIPVLAAVLNKRTLPIPERLYSRI
jgi:receptor protein-tyrosine kinase